MGGPSAHGQRNKVPLRYDANVTAAIASSVAIVTIARQLFVVRSPYLPFITP